MSKKKKNGDKAKGDHSHGQTEADEDLLAVIYLPAELYDLWESHTQAWRERQIKQVFGVAAGDSVWGLNQISIRKKNAQQEVSGEDADDPYKLCEGP